MANTIATYEQCVKYLEDNSVVWANDDFSIQKPANNPSFIQHWDEGALGPEPAEDDLDDPAVAEAWYQEWRDGQESSVSNQPLYTQADFKALVVVLNRRFTGGQTVTEQEYQDEITVQYDALNQ